MAAGRSSVKRSAPLLSYAHDKETFMEEPQSEIRLPPAISPETWRSSLAAAVDKHEQKFAKSKKRWNKWYYGCLYGSVTLSALAALVLKLEFVGDEDKWQNDVAALFATMAAILGTVMSAGNFERRWRAARRARAALLQLKIELLDPGVDPVHVRQNLQRVITIYDEEAAGERDFGDGTSWREPVAKQGKGERKDLGGVRREDLEQ